MGKAARKKLLRRIQLLESRSSNVSSHPGLPWYESNLLWVPTSTLIGIIFLLIGTVKNDYRWLLLIAWALLLYPLWTAVKNVISTSKRFHRYAFLLLFALSGYGLYGFNLWLASHTGTLTPEQIENRVRAWLSNGGYLPHPAIAPLGNSFAIEASYEDKGHFMVRQERDGLVVIETILGATKPAQNVFSKLSPSQLAEVQREVEIELLRFDIHYVISEDSKKIGLRHKVAIDHQMTQEQFNSAIMTILRAGELVELKTADYAKKHSLE